MAETFALVVRRARAHLLVLSASAAAIVLTTTLLVTLSVFTGAVSAAGLRATLAEAPPDETSVLVSAPLAGSGLAALDTTLRTRAAESFPGTTLAVHAGARSAGYDLPGSLEVGRETQAEQEGEPPITFLAFLEDLPAHATLIEGRWLPDPPRQMGTGPVPAVLPEQAAAALGLRAGDTLHIAPRAQGRPLDVRVAGVYRPREPGSPYWTLLPVAAQGREVGTFTTVGPLVVSRASFAERFTPSATLLWRVGPDLDGVTPEELDRLGQGALRLHEVLADAEGFGEAARVSSDLPALDERSDRALLVSRSTLLIPITLLVLLALYTLLLTARLLGESRRGEDALLRARGAATRQIAGLSVRETVLVAGPAAVASPVLAGPLLALLDRAASDNGSVFGLDIRLGWTAWSVAALVGFGCALVLALPALRQDRTYAETRQSRGRSPRWSAAARTGVDVALLGLAVLAYWQLRHYRSPLGGPAEDVLGIDPVLVAGPAVTLLGGAVLILRVVPWCAERLARLAARRSTFVASMGIWQVSRQPGRAAGPTLLLVLALAIGTMVVTQATTWQRSQQDQADFRVGADLRVTLPADRLPVPAQRDAYAGLPGVVAAVPGSRSDVSVGSDTPVTVLAVDAAAAPGTMTMRADLADQPLPDLLEPLTGNRPQGRGPTLPAGTARLEVTLRMAASGEMPSLSAVVRDRAGMLHALPAGRFAPDGQDHVLGANVPASEGVLELVALTLDRHLYDTTETVELTGISAVTGGERHPLVPDSSWAAHSTEPAAGAEATSATTDADGGIVLGLQAPGHLVGPAASSIRFVLTPLSLPDSIPVVATDGLLDTLDMAVGDPFTIWLGRAPARARIAHTAKRLPTLSTTSEGLLVDLPTYSAVSLAVAGFTVEPGEWWIDVRDDRTGPTATALAADPRLAATVHDRMALGRELRDDPLAASVRTALLVGLVAAIAFAVIGFAVHVAVAIRRRRGDHTVLRAIGVSRRQLLGAFTLEQAMVVTVGTVIGTALGAAIGSLVTPLITLTREGTSVVPEVLVAVPWATMAVLVLAVLALLAVVVALVAWSAQREAFAGTLRQWEEP